MIRDRYDRMYDTGHYTDVTKDFEKSESVRSDQIIDSGNLPPIRKKADLVYSKKFNQTCGSYAGRHICFSKTKLGKICKVDYKKINHWLEIWAKEHGYELVKVSRLSRFEKVM